MPSEIARTVFQEEHEAFRRSVRAFLESEVLPQYETWEEAGKTPREIWLRAGEIGLLGTSIPEAYGGAGGDFRYDAVVLEELGRLSIGAPAWDMHSYIVAPFLTHFGTEAQKAEWLPRMAAGEAIAAIGLTEPGTGSDLGGIRTSATRDGDAYLLQGSKIFITNGIIADFVLVAAKTSPELGAKGISLFIVDTQAPGFRRGRKLRKIGNHAQDTAELFFDGVRVPADRLLGGIENQGWAQLMHGLAQERMVVAVRSIAMAQASFEATLDYVRSRTAWGKPIVSFQNTRFKLAEMETEIDVGRPFVDRCIELLAENRLSPEMAAKAKLWTTELADRVIDECLQLHGGYGYMAEYPISRSWTDARVHRIWAGTSEVMKHIISRAY
ncbi:acyl-CoA dehydrogenase family protein [Enterovirga aerilata]|uniref:Acyl-[acyl-carrier-protein] dehydrogenase MbtN n=1 Tax=Enterovirga aerilata TaxID=2730920 RepID=A0A849IMJ2_9HYPH|nr:acyl-CoA dehydrogenase family protein [Enterovirga sp. DB1703]NNM75163.1 acyl-CoA dehydrogenase [Enterovirga sp. DB1703]